MRNKRIRNSQRGVHFRTGNDLLSPCSSSRNEIEIQQFSDKCKIIPNNENMLHNMKLKFLLNSLVKKIKHLTPLSVVPPNIAEEWQIQAEQQNLSPQTHNQYAKQTLSEELSHRFELFRHMSLIEGIFIALFCWIVTVSVVFREKIGLQFLITTLVLSLARIVLLGTIAIKEKDNQQASFLLDGFNDLASPTMLVVACALFIIRCLFDVGPGTYIIEAIGLLTVIFQYKQLEISFRIIVKFAEQNRMKKELRIVELFMLVITLAHFFGLIFYVASYMKPGNAISWIERYHLDEQQWHIQYIYCLYWAITTMVTVGYGDLTPQNWVEVLIVMGIQLIGTAVFGYMINVIGITVDEIKKKNEEFDNYQETIDKLRDHYQLSRQLCHKMKHDIKQKENEFQSIPLKTVEEKDFLDYIQPNLKEEFVLETNMKVIKKSIFFLTHFSVNFQNEIALRLIRIIYKPGEEIPIFDSQQPDCQRSMVIINSGWVDIFVENHHNTIQIMKKVRDIKPSEDALVMNVFGYSSLIMNRNIKLRAITKQTAVSYVLRRKDVLECIEKSMLDFESFNQIREKMLMYKFLEEIQAPTMKDSDWHFIPNIFLLQKKITYENQHRLIYLRNKTRIKMRLVTAKHYQNKTLPKIDDERIEQENAHYHMNTIDEQFQSLTSFETDKAEDQVTFHNYEPDSYLSKLKIDQCKVFENFMKPSNLPLIAAAYERSCQKKSYKKRINTSVIVKKKHGTYILKMLGKDRMEKASRSTQEKNTFFS